MKAQDVSDFSPCVVCFKLLQKHCKNHLWFQFPSSNQPWPTFWQGNETVKKIPYGIPLGKRDFQRIQTSLSIMKTCAKMVSKVAASGKKHLAPFQNSLEQGQLKTISGSAGHLRLCSPVNPTTQLLPMKNTAFSKGLLNDAPKVKLFKELGSFLMSGKAVHGNPSTHVSSQTRFTRVPGVPRVSGRTNSTKMNGKSAGRWCSMSFGNEFFEASYWQGVGKQVYWNQILSCNNMVKSIPLVSQCGQHEWQSIVDTHLHSPHYMNRVYQMLGKFFMYKQQDKSAKD